MSDYVFLFDLDSTITKVEILPEIARYIGKEDELRKLTEKTMMGEIPFEYSFIERVNMLKDIDVGIVNNTISDIPLNDGIVRFIKENRERCYVVTGNLDVWISGLMHNLDMQDHCFCSKAAVEDGKIKRVISVINKREVASRFLHPVVAIGDGDNDVELMQPAAIRIGFGGVRRIAASLIESIDFAVYDDRKLYKFLVSLL